jgi:hypothetical protein
VEDVIARRIGRPSGLRKAREAARSAAESRGFTAVLVAMALVAVIIVLGMITFPAGRGQRTDTAAGLPLERPPDTERVRSD